MHLQFYKRLLGVKRTTQNDVVYCELGGHTFQMFRYINIVKYWVKILFTDVLIDVTGEDNTNQYTYRN